MSTPARTFGAVARRNVEPELLGARAAPFRCATTRSSWLERSCLGIVQDLTEPPISSSAHLLIVGQLFFDVRDPGAAFTAMTQIGTESSVIVYFGKDIRRIVCR